MSLPKAVIIGSGPAGATVARVLAKSGLYDVTVLDKGRNWFTGLGTSDPSSVSTVFANDELDFEVDDTSMMDQDPFVQPRTYRTDPSAGPRTYVGVVDNLTNTVGGTWAHADVKARRFREVDFEANSLMGGTADKPAIPGTSYADWPISYQQLEPFYAVTEEVVGIQGPARRLRNGKIHNPNPYESPRSTPFPMPPGVQQLNSLLPADAAQRLGYHPAPVPTGAISRPYRGRTDPCNDCGFCGNYGCPNNSKSGGIWQLNDAMAAGAQLISRANVVHIQNSGRRATGVYYIDGSGVTQFIDASGPQDVVVMANTPFEATRLCLLSGIGKAPDENNLSTLQTTSNEPSGLLGRNLMLHLQTIVLALVDQDIHAFRGRTSTQTLDAFVGSGPSRREFDPAVPMGGLLEIGGNRNPVSQALDLAQIGIGARHKLLMDLAPFVNHITTFTMQGQDMPQLDNYVDLDPDVKDVWGNPVPRITYRNHPYELAASAYYTPRMVEIMANIGGPGSRYPDVKPIFIGELNTTTPSVLPGAVDTQASPLTGATPFNDIPADQHIMGTHRMALDEGHGVCDPYGRMWGYDNLYVAGGALFPTAPGFNPTVTIYATSYWLAAALVKGVGGRGSYAPAYITDKWQDLLSVIATIDSDTMIARAIANHQLVR